MKVSGRKFVLRRAVRRELEKLIRRRRAPHVLVQRARIVLLAHEGWESARIARRVGVSSRTVRKWKARFRDNPCQEGLKDLPRSGRPAQVPIEVRCQLVQLACERPGEDGTPVPFRDVWTYQALADAVAERTGHRISVSEVGRILRFEEIRPHRVRQWLKCADPEFMAKARKVCGLYLRPPEDAVVICMDEKPMQALERRHPSHVNIEDGSIRFEYEYKRHGTQSLLGAFEVATGRVFGRVVPHRDAETLVGFMNEIARRYPRKRVIVVWDNLNIHYDGNDRRWTSFNERHGGRFSFVYTPKHASWMNQIEVWFSILQRRVLKHGSFSSLKEQAGRVLGYIDHWNRWERHPFRWTWRTDRMQNRRRHAA